MDFQYTEDLRAFRDMASEFARDRLFPSADEWDEASYFPKDVLREAASLGMAGLVVNEDLGGSGLPRLAAAMIFEQLGAACVSTSAYLSIHNMVTSLIDQYASDELRQTWIPKLVTMDLFASYCLTEPDSGTDAAALKTQAVKQDDVYVLNGSKAFISGGGESDVYLCMVRTGDQSYHGISCLLIEKDTPGLSFGKQEKKLGWKTQPTSMLFFEDCKVPLKNLVGKEGEGFKIALHALNAGRVNIASCSLGGALACLRLSQAHLNDRKQFGKSLSQMQALRFYFADMLTNLEAARLMVYRAATALDNNHPDKVIYCAMAKRLATDSAFEISDKAMQLHGGYGYLRDAQIERFFRDLRAHQIIEGTNEIMREIIAKATLDTHYDIN